MSIDPQTVYLIFNGIDLLFKRLEQQGVELTEEERAAQTAVRKQLVEQARNMLPGNET